MQQRVTAGCLASRVNGGVDIHDVNFTARHHVLEESSPIPTAQTFAMRKSVIIFAHSD
jgi:hypothetical protein